MVCFGWLILSFPLDFCLVSKSFVYYFTGNLLVILEYVASRVVLSHRVGLTGRRQSEGIRVDGQGLIHVLHVVGADHCNTALTYWPCCNICGVLPNKIAIK